MCNSDVLKTQMFLLEVTILLSGGKLLAYWDLQFCLVLPEFSTQYIPLSPYFHRSSQGESENKLRRTDKLQHLLCTPGLILLLRWHCHQAEAVFFRERRGWLGAWARGCSQDRYVTGCIVSWETHPSNRHLCFYAGSLQKEAACPRLGILKR